MPPIHPLNGFHPSNYCTFAHIPILIFNSLMSNFSLQVETALLTLIGCISILLRNILVQAFGCTGKLKEWSAIFYNKENFIKEQFSKLAWVIPFAFKYLN